MRLIELPTLKRPKSRARGARLTVRQINLALWVAAACLCGLAIAILVLGLMFRVDKPESIEADSGPQRRPVAKRLALIPPLESFDAVLARPLRRPLIDPVATAQPVQPAVAPQMMQMTLAGTIGNSLAMLRTLDGQIYARGVGDVLNGVQIVAIHSGSVDVRFRGVPLTLTKPKDAAPFWVLPARPNAP